MWGIYLAHGRASEHAYELQTARERYLYHTFAACFGIGCSHQVNSLLRGFRMMHQRTASYTSYAMLEQRNLQRTLYELFMSFL